MTDELRVSLTTIKSRLNKAGLSGRKARKKPFITRVNAKIRLTFASQNVHHPPEFWRRHIFSDETQVQKSVNDKGNIVWRKSGTAFDVRNTNSSVKHLECMMMWGCFSHAGLGNWLK